MVIGAYLHDPVVHLISALALAALMASAGWHKLRNPDAFANVLSNYAQAMGFSLPGGARALLQYLLPGLELLAAAAVLMSPWLPVAAWPVVCLLALYALVLAVSAKRGAAIEDCGCHFGSKPQPPSMALAWRNVLLVLVAVNLTLPMLDRPWVWFDAVTGLFALLSAVMVYLLANLLISNRISLRELS